MDAIGGDTVATVGRAVISNPSTIKLLLSTRTSTLYGAVGLAASIRTVTVGGACPPPCPGSTVSDGGAGGVGTVIAGPAMTCSVA